MDHIPNTRALKTLVAAGRHLNFTRAAEEVNLTPAAVSHQIKELEDQLGLTLFNRNNRTVRLTEAGAMMVAAAQESLDLLARTVARARKLDRAASVLRLTMEATFAARWMMPRLVSFRKSHPDIELRLDITERLRDFDVDDVDAGIRFGAGRYPGVYAEPLFDNIVVPVCSPAMMTGDRPLRQPRDLFDVALCHVVWSMPGGTWPRWKVWMAAAGIDDFDDSRCISFTDSTHSVQAALDGHAVALADHSMVADDIQAGRLVRPFDIGIRMEPQFAFYFVCAERDIDLSHIQVLRRWLLSEARKTDALVPPSMK